MTSPAEDYAVEIVNLSYTYADGNRALTDIDLKIRKSSNTAILGANGSGKTTLIYHLNGIFQPEQGQVRIFSETLTQQNVDDIRKKVGLLFDHPDTQLFANSVATDVAFGPRNLNWDEHKVFLHVREALQHVDMLDLQDQPPYNLSLGQKKRAAIAGLLAMEPDILVCDEPFSGLDPRMSAQFSDILNMYQNQNKTLILSTHDVDLAYRWADEVIIMKNGRLMASGSVALLTDESFMAEAHLEVPVLAKLFAQTGYAPRTAEQAQQAMQELLRNKS